MFRHHTHLNRPQDEGWILPGIIPQNGLVIVASAPKTGKTVLVNAILRAIASGGTFAGIGWQQKIPVAWCAHEETIHEKSPLLAGLRDDDPFYVSFPPELPFIDDPDCDYESDRFGRYNRDAIPYAYEQAAKVGARVLAVDCLHAAVRYSNLADNQVARRTMAKLRHWSDAFGIATVVLHHLTKSAHRGYHPERFADSAQILAAASCHFFLESETLENGTRRIVLHGAGRQPAPPARQEFIATSLFDYQRVELSERAKQPTVADRVAELLDEGWELTATEIARRLSINLKSVRNSLAQLPCIERIESRSRDGLYRSCRPTES